MQKQENSREERRPGVFIQIRDMHGGNNAASGTKECAIRWNTNVLPCCAFTNFQCLYLNPYLYVGFHEIPTFGPN